MKISRRKFLQASALAVSSFAIGANAFTSSAKKDAFAFPLLGDVHIDKLAFHDPVWLRSIGDRAKTFTAYDKMTAQMTPRLFSTVKETIADLNKNPATRVPFVVQVGDFVDGYCGKPSLARAQAEYGVDFVRKANLPAPFLFTKGNHDVAGKGAREAYQEIFLPFLSEQIRVSSQKNVALKTAYYSVEHGNSLFLFFDAYDKNKCLDWMEATLAKSKARHVFVVIHPPAVPYGGRPDWHLFAHGSEKKSRSRFLNLLGRHRAILLSGHLHKFNSMVRRTDSGNFLQLAVCSVIHSPDVHAGGVLSGVQDYAPGKISLNAEYSAERKKICNAMLEAEKPFVKHFEYAVMPGYAVIEVEDDTVRAKFYSGVSRQLWKTLDLTALLAS